MNKSIREQVYAKFNGHCAYCGREIAYKDMQADHIKPQCNGGTDDINNLFPACRTCNHYKRAKKLETFRKDISTIPCKLGERQYIYKVGMAYGFYDNKPRDVKFYFEKVNKGETNRELWLKRCTDTKNYPYLLETNGNVELYQLKIIDNPDYNSYDHYHTTYHVWDKINDKWVFTSTDYRAAYLKYKSIT